MLKKIRVALSLLIFVLLTFFFIDFTNLLPMQFHALAHIQFVPALLSKSLILVFVLLAITLLFGRIYCSSICPMGTFQDIASWVAKRISNKKKRYKYSPAKTILRWSILGVSVLAYISGFSVIFSFIDPYSAYGRMVSNLLQPVYMAGNNVLEALFTSFGKYTFDAVEIVILSTSTFIVALLTFAIIGFLAWRYGRTFCNTICPVGTVLGFVHRFSFFKVRIDAHTCNGCGACAARCKASCIDTKTHTIDDSRCISCFNCIGTCNQNALHYAPYTKPKTVQLESQNRMDVNKRRFLTSSITTAILVPLVLAQDKIDTLSGNKAYVRQTPISPPGAKATARLLHHCTACQLCISKCPSNVLKPAYMEYGLAGIMQPVMNYERGFCNPNCTLCMDVCPTKALVPLTTEQKRKTKIGYAVFSPAICWVKTDEIHCGSCAESCPTQAIKMIPYGDGLEIPSVDTNLCVGCGACEYACPATPYTAMRVEGFTVHK